MDDMTVSRVIAECEKVIKLAKEGKIKIINIVGIADVDEDNYEILNTCWSSHLTSWHLTTLHDTYVENLERLEDEIKIYLDSEKPQEGPKH